MKWTSPYFWETVQNKLDVLRREGLAYCCGYAIAEATQGRRISWDRFWDGAADNVQEWRRARINVKQRDSRENADVDGYKQHPHDRETMFRHLEELKRMMETGEIVGMMIYATTTRGTIRDRGVGTIGIYAYSVMLGLSLEHLFDHVRNERHYDDGTPTLRVTPPSESEDPGPEEPNS